MRGSTTVRLIPQAAGRLSDKQPALDRLDASTTSDSKLLQWLLRYPFQRVQDWALVQGIDQSTAFRQIQQAQRMGWVGSVPLSTSTNTCRLSYLSAQGLEVMAQALKADPAQLAQTFGVDEHSLLRQLACVPLLSLVQQVVNRLLMEAPAVLSPGGQSETLTWQWQRAYRHPFLSHQQRCWCEAEAVLVWHVRRAVTALSASSDRWYSLWLLIDPGLTGQHDERIISRRLERLLRYRECEERTAIQRWFPPVLILVPSLHQQEVWRRCAQEVACTLHLLPLVGALATLPSDPDRSSVWHLCWKTLGQGTPCHLSEVMQPLPRAALPAGVLSSERTVSAQTVPGTGCTRGTVLVDDLVSRAQHLSHSRSQETAERATVALLSLRLTSRQMALLHLLYTAPLLSVPELACLLEVQEASVARTLTALFSAGLLCASATAAGRRYALSSRGLRLLAARWQIPLQHLAAPVASQDFPHRGQRVSLTREIACGAAGVALCGATGTILSTERDVRVRMDAPLCGGTAPAPVLRWPLGSQQALLTFRRECAIVEARVPGEWVQRCVRQMRLRLLSRPAAIGRWAGIYGLLARLHRAEGGTLLWWEIGRWCQLHSQDATGLRPDARLAYRAGTRTVLAWLIWEAGEGGSQRLFAHLTAYAASVQSREGHQERGTALPLLLVVVSSADQEQHVRQWIERLMPPDRLVVWVTTAARLSVQDILAPLWQQVWPSPSPGASRRSWLDLPSERENQKGVVLP